jgi:dihydroorotate dehydrogenase (fumarate)
MDLTTSYMGLVLKNPFVASASPLSESVDTIRRLEDHGAGAVVMFSLFEEQIRHDREAMEHFMGLGTDSVGEALSYFPQVTEYDVGPAQYLDLIRKASDAVDVPIIASLNGVTHRGWTGFARQMQDAGAKGLELNVYYIPTEMYYTGVQVEQQYLDVLRAVKAAVTIPVALKVGPYFSSFAHTAGQFDAAGADVVMSTSALLQQGPAFLSRLVADVSGWMQRKGYTSVSQMRGSMSQQSIPDSTAFVRGNYIRVLESYKAG